MPASSAAMSASQQKYERVTIGRWYWGYVRISQKYPRCEGRYFRRTDTNVQRPRTVLNPASMHSIVYVVISTRKGVERSDCSKMTAWILLPAPAVQRSNSSGCKSSKLFFRHQAWPETYLERRRSTNPNCCDTSVMLSQLETSRPRGSERVVFIAFGNFRSFTRDGCLVLGELDNFTAPVAGYRLHLFRKKISSVKFNHFRHNIIPSTRT